MKRVSLSPSLNILFCAFYMSDIERREEALNE